MPSEQTHPQIPFVSVKYGIVNLFFVNGGEDGSPALFYLRYYISIRKKCQVLLCAFLNFLPTKEHCISYVDIL